MAAWASRSGRPPAPAGEKVGLTRRRSPAGALALLSVIALALLQVALLIDRYPQFSPVDELQHADYMIKAAHGQLLRRGDTIGPEATREAACRGIVDPNRVVPDCTTNRERPPWLVEQTGVNSEEIQPPVFYVITGVLARGIRAVLGMSSIVTAGRLVGGLWLAAGAAVLWALLGRMQVKPVARWGVTALVACSPQMLGVAAVINNDVTALVAGAAVLLAAVAWEQRSLHGGLVLAVVAAAISIKPTNVVGVGVAAGYLVIRALVLRDRADRQVPAMLRMGAAMVGVAALTGLGFLALHEAIARAGPDANPNTAFFKTDNVPAELVVRAIPNGITPTRDPFLPPFLATTAVRTIARAGHWVLLGATIVVIAAAARRSREWPLALSALAACALAGPAYVILNYVASHIYFNIPPRYALSAVPGLAVVLAAVLRRPLAARVLAGLAGLGSLVVLVTLARA